MKMSYDKMKEVFNADFDYFKKYGELVEVGGRRYIYKDNGANILAVAHLDNVNDNTHFHILKGFDKEYGDAILSTRVDDRLGAYIILEVLPKHGIKYDILLCDEEEVGKSTAELFKTDKQYNWGFEFDRRLDGVVTYMYGGHGNKDWDNLLEPYFKKVHVGSTSDISKLSHLGCKFMNIGVGYDREHDAFAHFFPALTNKQIGLFVNFYGHNHKIHYPHVPPPPPDATIYSSYRSREWYNLPDDDTYLDGYRFPDKYPSKCEHCDIKLTALNRSQLYIGTCSACASKGMDLCELCDKYFPLDKLEGSGSFKVCQECIPYTLKCDRCNGLTINAPFSSEEFPYDKVTICDDCIETFPEEEEADIAVECDGCHHKTIQAEVVYANGYAFNICPDCL